MPEQAHGVARVERREHARVPGDLGEAEQAQGGEPGQHHRPEEPAHAGRAAALEEEEDEEHEDGERHDVGPERGAAVSSPSTAASTEIAGVIRPSP